VGVVAGTAWFRAEVFGTEESSERRGSGGGREQHGLWRRALMYLGGLEGDEHVSPFWMGSDFDHYNYYKEFRLRVKYIKIDWN